MASQPSANTAVGIEAYQPPGASLPELADAYRLRWVRRRYLWRAFRSRHDLETRVDRTHAIRSGDILVFACMRNEAERLPRFLAHYRALGAAHFLIIDNGSDDGTAEALSAEADVSVWHTTASYRSARFGMNWVNHLLARYGHGHWCLTVDADELFTFREAEARGLAGLTADLDATGRQMFGALMLDMYPRGPLGAETDGDPHDALTHFDPSGYTVRVKTRTGALWIQGGPRARVFFGETPERAPTLNKTPLVKWHWRYAYVSSTHALLPARLNAWHGDENGILLHTKFLPSVTDRAQQEKGRREHFNDPTQFDAYYDALSEGPVLWNEGSSEYRDWRDADRAGLLNITRAT